jgi:hypothetical protein
MNVMRRNRSIIAVLASVTNHLIFYDPGFAILMMLPLRRTLLLSVLYSSAPPAKTFKGHDKSIMAILHQPEKNIQAKTIRQI